MLGTGWGVVGHKLTAPPLLLTKSEVQVGTGPPRSALSMPLSLPSPHNTLYLELWCPTVAPAIVVTSGKGKTVFDFGDIAVGVS
jgi:hypothetical protein